MFCSILLLHNVHCAFLCCSCTLRTCFPRSVLVLKAEGHLEHCFGRSLLCTCIIWCSRVIPALTTNPHISHLLTLIDFISVISFLNSFGIFALYNPAILYESINEQNHLIKLLMIQITSLSYCLHNGHRHIALSFPLIYLFVYSNEPILFCTNFHMICISLHSDHCVQHLYDDLMIPIHQNLKYNSIENWFNSFHLIASYLYRNEDNQL